MLRVRYSPLQPFVRWSDALFKCNSLILYKILKRNRNRNLPSILLMLELCMSGHALSILRRSSRAHTIKAFIGRLICGRVGSSRDPLFPLPGDPRMIFALYIFPENTSQVLFYCLLPKSKVKGLKVSQNEARTSISNRHAAKQRIVKTLMNDDDDASKAQGEIKMQGLVIIYIFIHQKTDSIKKTANTATSFTVSFDTTESCLLYTSPSPRD